MKYIYEVEYDIKNGDVFNMWYETASDAERGANNLIDRLTKSEKKRARVILYGYKVDVPENYNYTTAEKFAYDLFDGNITIPQYDFDACQFTDIIKEEEVFSGWND